ncbi:MAG: hypothetical protein R3A10_03065 [Caldilineaceae bacterium]
MLNRKNLVVVVALVLMVSMLAGCAAGNAMLERDVTIDPAAAMAAQQKAIAGLGSGQVEWTEQEFSSLLTLLIQQNLGTDMISGVKANFDPSGLTLAVGTPMGEAVLKGNIMVEDNILKVNLRPAPWVWRLSARSGRRPGKRSNRALNDPSMGVAVDVQMGDSTLALSLR